MTLTAPATATGSTLVAVDRHQAGDWQQALAGLGRRLPVGWDASGERTGGVAGYDLVLAAPRTLSALAWFLMSANQDHLADPILQAHHDALRAVAVEFGCATGAEAPTMSATPTTQPASPGRTPTWSSAPWPPPTTASSRLTRAGLPSKPSGTSSATTCWSGGQ
jgi:hypothetical protein